MQCSKRNTDDREQGEPTPHQLGGQWEFIAAILVGLELDYAEDKQCLK